MKTIKILIVAVATLGLVSCEDFLTTEPLTTVTDANYYKTPGDAYTALVGCYDGLQTIWAGGIALPLASEIMSDNCYGGFGASDAYNFQAIDEFDLSRAPSYQNLYGDNWSAYYEAVYRCNILLSKMDQIEWGTEENLRPIYEAETRFIRAYLYFDMVRLWGNIPLLTEASTENLPQSDPTAVYQLIAEDLVFAAQNLEGTPYTSQAQATYGRVTKWAAEALIGRVYLYYTGYYGQPDLAGVVSQSDALAFLEDVISNGGFGLVENFANLWPAASGSDYVGEDNQETVFAIKYTYTSDYNGNTDGNHWLVMFGMREQSFFPYGNGWGGGTVSPKLWNAYADEDSRKVASIISVDDEGFDFDVDRQREYTGYYNKKYTPMSDEDGNSVAVELGGTNFMIGQFQDYVSIRYSDVLLMAAELGSANAQSYFDMVRQRALGDAFTALSPTKANILQERYLEFALEGLRYYDLLRQGLDVTAAAIAEETTLLSAGNAETKSISSADFMETQGLQQIPNTQITLSSGVLKQNAGW
ncbi:RagB/SusD family nutrient uptake outer membrane protein [Marinoscillum pacificum]|uniref:RagB/SusD family nutrient uptake outer membrane protein n=1 Tax=Marinoscillum pacificum TaxID=392723 RepID=UPI0021579507|nr:RagB/SusD family nutrient uptake outer membrane protein [Marinoscillum pacificum]